MTTSSAPVPVYICCSRDPDDQGALQRLYTELIIDIRSGRITCTDRSRFPAGTDLPRAIERAIASARIAILLLSSHLLAQDEVYQRELMPILAARERGLIVLPVLLRTGTYQSEVPFVDIQCGKERGESQCSGRGNRKGPPHPSPPPLPLLLATRSDDEPTVDAFHEV